MSGEHLSSDDLRTYLLEGQECLARDRGALKCYKYPWSLCIGAEALSRLVWCIHVILAWYHF